MAAAGRAGCVVPEADFISGVCRRPGCRAGWPGVPRLPGVSFLARGTDLRWSGRVLDGVDAFPGGDDLLGPGPGRGDFEVPAGAAADQAGGCVQDAVAQCLRLRLREVAVQGQEPQPGQQDARDHGRVEPRLVDLVVAGGEMTEPGVLAGADDVLDPGMDAMGGVDIGALAQPAFRVRGAVGDPQGVAPAVRGLEEGQLRAGVRPLTAGEDPHRLRPGLELITGRAVAQQPGQLGDVRFLDPAPAVGAVPARAGTVSAALPDLALAVDGDLPGDLGDLADRGLLPRAQFPADRVGDLVAVPGGKPVQLLDQGVAGAGPVAGDHQLPAQRGRERGDRVAQQAQVIGGGVAAGRARPPRPGDGLPRV